MLSSKVCSKEKIIEQFKDGQIIAIGGQTGRCMPDRLIDCVLESGARYLTIYSLDTGWENKGIGKLIHERVVDKVITSHVGTNPETNRLIQAGLIKVELIPMGTFAERIRCGGMGLGGVLTKTGLGTIVEKGKQMIDVALTHSRRADPIGNLTFRGSTGRADHPLIATCADLSIVECDHFCDLGEISPETVEVPGMFIDMILV